MNKFILQKLFDLNLFIKILLKALYIISMFNQFFIYLFIFIYNFNNYQLIQSDHLLLLSFLSKP